MHYAAHGQIIGADEQAKRYPSLLDQHPEQHPKRVFDLNDMRRYLHVEVLGNSRFFVTVLPNTTIPRDHPSLPWYAKIAGRLWELKGNGSGIAFTAEADPTKVGHYKVTDSLFLATGSFATVPLRIFENLPRDNAEQKDEPANWEEQMPRVIDALGAIDPEMNRETWLTHILWPLCDASGGDDGFYHNVLEQWADQTPKYATDIARTRNRYQWEWRIRNPNPDDKDDPLRPFFKLAYSKHPVLAANVLSLRRAHD